MKCIKMAKDKTKMTSFLHISEATISGLISGRKELSNDLAKTLNSKLNIDTDFFLNIA
jgi:plasmid maintenance system antidote protein VapI